MNLKAAIPIIKLSIIVLFAISLVVGFFMGIINVETFIGVVGPTIGYLFADQKNKKEIEALKTEKAEIINLNAKKEKI